MKFSQALSAAALFGAALAYPTDLTKEKRQGNIDPIILQFALTLEHLENVFYEGALKNFSQQDFMDAGYSADYYNNLMYISHDEQVHVQTLTAAIAAAGYAPVAACQYSFPYTDVVSFITLSSVLEGVGTSAYLGGAPLITSKAYLTVAGSILVTEALHTSMQRGAIGEVPEPNPFGTPLDPTSVFTLAAMFIVSCPASNMALPFKPFPTLSYSDTCTCEEPDCTPDQEVRRDYTETASAWGYEPSKGWEAPSATYTSAWYSSSYTSAMPMMTTSAAPPPPPPSGGSCAPPTAGASITLKAAGPIKEGSYVTFVNGLSVVSVAGTVSGDSVTVTIPGVVQGQAYVFVTSMDVETTFSDSAVLFGPAIVEVDPPKPVIDFSLQ